MAAVTLKDLMDPLTKIQAATEQTANSLDALISVVTATGEVNKTATQSITKSISALTTVVAATGQVNKTATESTTKSIAALTNVMASSGQVGDGIQSAILVELQLQSQLLRNRRGGGLASLFGGGKKGGGRRGAKGLRAGGDAFAALGAGTMQMAKALLMFMLVPAGAIKKFNNFVMGQLEMFGKMDTKKAEEGAKILGMLGVSILKFVGSLALAAILLIPAAIGIPLLYLSVMLIVPLFVLLGMVEKQVKKGVNALGGIGMALAKFALGLATFALVTFFILMQPIILIGMVATLVLIGGAVALLGLFSKQIRKGSVALAVMGIGLMVFGLGYAVFAFTIAKTAPTLESIGIQAGILVGIGVVTGILGALFSYIIQGAISLALMGIGLLVFGLGYMPFASATEDTTWEDVGIQSALLTALGVVFGLAGAGAMFIIPGALAFAAIGGALLLLAPGLKAIKKVDFTEADALKLTTTLSGVKAAFLGTDGADEGGIGGFFKKIGGAIGGAVDSVRMIAAAAGFAAAGMALTRLSVGLKDYKKLDWTDSDSLRLTGVLSGITTAFAQAGGESANPGGLFGAIFGSAFSPNATKKGISSVMKAGKALTSIATGLTAFQKLVDKDVDFEYIGKQIELTVGFIQRAFAAVADEGNVDAGGFFGTLFGIKKNKVAEGLDAVTGAGDALTGIAEGLTAFQKLVESDVDFDKVGVAISKSVGFIQEAFAAVADQGNVQAGGFWNSLFKIKKNKVQEGIKSVQGAGAELNQIAEGLSTFSGIEDPEGVAEKIQVVVGMVGQAFAQVGGMETTDTGWFGISWDENLVEKGIDAVDGAGQALQDIATGLKAFSGDFEPVAVAKSVALLLTSIGTTFSDLYEKNAFISMQLDDFATFIVTIGDVAEKGQLDTAADGMSKIADAVNKIEIDKAVAFGDLFKSSSKLSSDKSAYRALAKAVGDIRDMMAAPPAGEEGGEEGGSKLPFGLPNPFASKEKASGKADPQLIKALSNINRTMTNLPAMISSIELEVKPST